MTKDAQELLRALPGVDTLLGRPELGGLDLPASLVKTAVREVIQRLRSELLAGGRPDLDQGRLALDAADLARELNRPSFKRVINATGVVIHTNLGRSLLTREAASAVAELALSYSNLEFDLGKGRRGSRYKLVTGLLQELTGAEAALVVNNNAAAVLVALNTLGLGREVIVSRGQLVEIGGSFRIPEVMSRAGAVLKEVGTTNKTHLEDYRAAIGENTAGLLKVHQSNFAMVGFSQVVPLAELVGLARERGLWVMEDLGSGSLLDLSPFGLPLEPTAAETIAQGADLVTFSGDKLLGGPQAGIILGTAEAVGRIQRNPINRAVRIDKMTLAALEMTLRLYRDPTRAMETIPTLKMLSLSEARLAARAARLKKSLETALAGVRGREVDLSLVKGTSQVGGGALPLADLPTRLVGIRVAGLSASRLEAFFRAARPPVIGRIEHDLFLLDPRTLLPGDGGEIGRVLVRAVQGSHFR